MTFVYEDASMHDGCRLASDAGLFVCLSPHDATSSLGGADRAGGRAQSATPHDLEVYFEPDSFCDWGDDPSFFAAKELLGSQRRATWSGCRRAVRELLDPGDYVVFVCGRHSGKRPRSWGYFLVGLA